ncbi:TVP38/TMEM64 family protein [Natronospora cellulosivora (SeqCode)]
MAKLISDISKKKIIQFAFMICVMIIMSFYIIDKQLDLTWIQSNLERLRFFVAENFFLAVFFFFLLRFFFALVSIPGGGALTVLVGALFDFFLAFLLVTLSVSFGSLLIFLLSRYAFQDYFKEKYKKQFSRIDKISRENGAKLLFLLRVNELVPSFIINSFFGLTSIKASTYYWVSLIGMLPGIFIFINAGSQITEIKRLSDLLTAGVILSLAALGIIPFIPRILVKFFQGAREVHLEIKD